MDCSSSCSPPHSRSQLNNNNSTQQRKTGERALRVTIAAGAVLFSCHYSDGSHMWLSEAVSWMQSVILALTGSCRNKSREWLAAVSVHWRRSSQHLGANTCQQAYSRGITSPLGISHFENPSILPAAGTITYATRDSRGVLQIWPLYFSGDKYMPHELKHPGSSCH